MEGAHTTHRDGQAKCEHKIAKDDLASGIRQRPGHAVPVYGGRLEHFFPPERDTVFFQCLEGIGGEEVLEAVAIADFGDFDRFTDAAGVAPVVAVPSDELVELGSPHAKGVHFTVVLAVHLERLFKIAVGALATDPEMFAQEICLSGMVAGPRPQADAEHLYKDFDKLNA